MPMIKKHRVTAKIKVPTQNKTTANVFLLSNTLFCSLTGTFFGFLNA